MLGFTPAEVKDMSIWEFQSAVNGWMEANSPEQGMTAAEEDAAWAAVQAKMGRVN